MHEEEEIIRQARELWQKYLALTKELLKFIDRQDIDTFMEIVPQRSVLIDRLKALPPNDFRHSEEGRSIIEEIKPMDQQIMYKARAWLNRSRRQNSAVRGYGISQALSAAGGILNKKY